MFENKDPDFMSTVAAFCESAMQRAEKNQLLTEKEQQLTAENLQIQREHLQRDSEQRRLDRAAAARRDELMFTLLQQMNGERRS